MEKDIRDEELAAMQAEGEEEVICVVLTDEQGNEHEFYQDMVITVDDKQFAVLVPMEDCCCEDERCPGLMDFAIHYTMLKKDRLSAVFLLNLPGRWPSRAGPAAARPRA